uniref:Uncharacterized protein n=1 Tax=Aegilops tauschii subsp. strangulata TaxID=200361 RepID=A0A453SJI0_AEGTS
MRRICCRVARVGLSAYAFEYEMSQDCWSTYFGLILTMSLVRTTCVCLSDSYRRNDTFSFLLDGQQHNHNNRSISAYGCRLRRLEKHRSRLTPLLYWGHQPSCLRCAYAQ